ncbi:ABC transporter substrate-binding protein [Desulfonema magnum]|uniref:ABC transporter substrate-binding protein n=1 Tax=Desulfonema magnum TaxID=45655 RepID=UPI001A9B780D|nr:ABC transporter substrate binding protein [Desulfonema magnum]
MKVLIKIILLLCVCIFLSDMSVLAQDKESLVSVPKTNNGKKWRIGYYEGGEYIYYQQIFTSTVKSLIKLGWIEKSKIPQQKGEQTKDLWNWLAARVRSHYIEFVPDGHYTGNWDDNLNKKITAEIIDRLNQKKDIDLIIAAGTMAGKNLANDKHKTSVLVISATDPVSAGIIKSVEDSGYDHIHAATDPHINERQVQIFHDIVGFDKLGVAYEDTVQGKSQAAIEMVESVAQERSFEIIRCYTKSDVGDVAIAEESVSECFYKLGKIADAIYVTTQGGVSVKNIPELVRIANSYKIPTFSQAGSDEVKRGLLFSISDAEFQYVAMFHAKTMTKIFNGASPRQLTQLFESPPKIAINLRTAQIIGYDPPVDVLGASDEIYQEIQP